MNVLFVCTGNTCRSPMAQALFNHLAKGKHIADSAGISAFDGMPASDGALTATAEKGLDLSRHSAKKVTPELLNNADLIVTMSPHHAYALIQAYGMSAEKIRILGDGVPDPYGLPAEYYRDTLKAMESAIIKLLEDLNGNEN